uniref:Protein LTV1 homolog n=1 Tax=Kalanchoe fedtschenkoi TaxID=63787 RepID=A0A7N0R830_KALFE
MGKKKFINKKQAATFQLIARDSSDPSYDENTPGSDRVFIRVDNSQYVVDSFVPDESSVCDSDSRFADAPEDCGSVVFGNGTESKGPLPEHVRKEILELGFPDDGYNYLLHLREIKNAGGGSAYYQNPKAKIEPLPLDVKAYDASRVPVPKVTLEETKDDTMYSVAAKSVGVRLQKAIDPEVAALLDDDDLSRFASDDDDLEEDFVVVANLALGGDEENEWVIDERLESGVVHGSKSGGVALEQLNDSGSSYLEENSAGLNSIGGIRNQGSGDDSDDKQQRVRRLLDDQFELLESQEYGSDEDDDDYGGAMGEEEENLADRLNHVLKDRAIDESEFGDRYKAPADLLLDGKLPEEVLKSASDLIRKCTEYAEKYENEDENGNDDVVLMEESSDESEVWDCETILSTYSNLDNHPAEIEAPGSRKRFSVNVADALSNPNNMISLQGKSKIPVEFLPRGRRVGTETVNTVDNSKVEPLRRKKHGQETKEEKKQRKAAVKEERSEARRMKKEMKGLYKNETQRAQKVVAVSGPSTIHLM